VVFRLGNTGTITYKNIGTISVVVYLRNYLLSISYTLRRKFLAVESSS